MNEWREIIQETQYFCLGKLILETVQCFRQWSRRKYKLHWIVQKKKGGTFLSQHFTECSVFLIWTGKEVFYCCDKEGWYKKKSMFQSATQYSLNGSHILCRIHQGFLIRLLMYTIWQQKQWWLSGGFLKELLHFLLIQLYEPIVGLVDIRHRC